MPLTTQNVGVLYLDIEAPPVLQKNKFYWSKNDISKTSQTDKAYHLPQPTTTPLSEHMMLDYIYHNYFHGK